MVKVTRKKIVTFNIHVKYESPTSNDAIVIANINIHHVGKRSCDL